MFTDNAYIAYVEDLICLHAELDLDQLSRFHYQKPVTSKFSILKSRRLPCLEGSVGGWPSSNSRKRCRWSGTTCQGPINKSVTEFSKWQKTSVEAEGGQFQLWTLTVTAEFWSFLAIISMMLFYCVCIWTVLSMLKSLDGSSGKSINFGSPEWLKWREFLSWLGGLSVIAVVQSV